MESLGNKPDEIDLIELFKTIWKEKRMIAKIASLFAVLGVVVSLMSPIVYTASSTFIPQSSQSGSGTSSLSGVASLVGINLGGTMSSTEISPTIYPQILESIPYKRELLEVSLKSSGDDSEILLKDYLLQVKPSYNVLGLVKKYTIMLPFTILNAIKGKKENVSSDSSLGMSVSLDEEELFRKLDGILSLNLNPKDKFISLSAQMGDPIKCAIVAKEAQRILQKRVINYRIKSASEVLVFNQTQLNLKKIEFDSLQNTLAQFKDSNLNIIDSRFENKLRGLEAEFSLVSSVYQELAKQLEQSKLQVSKDTPIFSVIKPVTIPNIRSAPERTQMVLMYLFFGLVLGCGYVLIKKPMKALLREIKS
ncbi:MAG: exopolysaccharide biosynthesis protein [Flavobacteriaceae bacterium]|nr:exopolysaccharide biosynthesis protein [Flavobacteriaceae bacterium]|tara:strand:+ start:25028 stop:26119 length:1092 start_codon:yes stop_codon:yes gene_type:complete